MKINIQWSLKKPEDWDEIDSEDWENAPSKPEPVGGEEIDNVKGWPCFVDVQGVRFSGDHIAIEELTEGIKVTLWNDDDDDYPDGEKYAMVWTMPPLAPDANFNGAINTRQSRVIYAQADVYARFNALMPIENTTLEDWVDFVPPDSDITRHGIWMSDEKLKAHKDKCSEKGWRDYGQHLDAKELKNGKVKCQRSQGRYKKNEGTRTYYQRNNAVATGVHVASDELDLNTNSGASAPMSESVDASSDELAFVFTTASGEPDSADWPNGAYRCQLNVSSAGGLMSYGLLTIGGSAGHFATVDDGLTGDQETWTQDEAAFTGSGLKLATNTIDPASVDNTDRFECLIAVANADGLMAAEIVLDGGNTDSFSDGPWAAAVAGGQKAHNFGFVTIASIFALILRVKKSIKVKRRWKNETDDEANPTNRAG